MAESTTNAPGAPGGTAHPAATPDLVGLAAQLGAKHGARGGAAPSPAGPGPAGGKNKGGRASAEDEARKFLASRNLVAVPAGAAEPQAPVAAGPAYVVDPEFVKGCTATLLKGVEAFRVRAVYLKTEALSGDKNLAREFANEAGAPPGAIDVMTMCMVELTKKYDMLNAATPEALLVIAGLVWAAKDLTLHARLNKLAESKAAAEKKAEKKDEKA